MIGDLQSVVDSELPAIPQAKVKAARDKMRAAEAIPMVRKALLLDSDDA